MNLIRKHIYLDKDMTKTEEKVYIYIAKLIARRKCASNQITYINKKYDINATTTTTTTYK